MNTALPPEILKVIQVETVHQFERVRRSGTHNMMDRLGVAREAHNKDCHHLALVASEKSEYALLLKHWTALKEHYSDKDSDSFDVYKCPECGKQASDLECPDCNGGWDDEEDCWTCNGEGFMADEYECDHCGNQYDETDAVAAQETQREQDHE